MKQKLLLAALFVASLSVTSLSIGASAIAATCGGGGQKPCKIWERIPSCNNGLVEDFLKNRCVAKRRPACGRKNQRPCKIWERIPSCDKGLREDFGAGRCVATASLSCGKEGQRPCLIFERIPSCNEGLVENFLSNTCVATGPNHLRRQAEHVIQGLRPLIEATIELIRCGSIGPQIRRIEELVHSKDASSFNSSTRNDQCVRGLRQIAQRHGYQTFTLGLAGGASLGFGINSEVGIAFDVTERHGPLFFATLGYSAGWGTSVGNDIVVSFYKQRNNNIGGPAQGFVYSGAALGGGGASVWYDYDGNLQGASAFVSAGASSEVAVYNRVRTEVY